MAACLSRLRLCRYAATYAPPPMAAKAVLSRKAPVCDLVVDAEEEADDSFDEEAFRARTDHAMARMFQD